jgi:cephalosporin hydroxylase
MNPHDEFKQVGLTEIREMASDSELKRLTEEWFQKVNSFKYSYHFDFLGRPIIQYPQDMIAIQELIWKVKPDLIIETGIAHGGSLIQSAAMLALIDLSEAVVSNTLLDPKVSARRVVAVDIDIRAHNRKELEKHPLSSRLTLIEGSSVEASIVSRIEEIAKNHKNVMVFLDSNHTHEHVLSELKAYAHLVTVGSYCVVFDTVIENMPGIASMDRPWSPGNNPQTAVNDFLANNASFEIDKSIQEKLLITVAPNGYLRRII